MLTPADSNRPRIAWTERWQEVQAVGERRVEKLRDYGIPKMRHYEEGGVVVFTEFVTELA
jgi:hypothetical protein